MNEVEITKVEQDGQDGILITFSDGTIAGYVVEELLELRPFREESANFDGGSSLSTKLCSSRSFMSKRHRAVQ